MSSADYIDVSSTDYIKLSSADNIKVSSADYIEVSSCRLLVVLKKPAKARNQHKQCFDCVFSDQDGQLLCLHKTVP